jgi:hypothetical protein
VATQTLEANATPGLTITGKVFALESDTVAASVVGTAKTNDSGRYLFAFTDLPAGAYRFNGFASGVGGFINEVYDLTLTTDVFIPRSEAASNELGSLAADIISGLSSVTPSVVQSWEPVKQTLHIIRGNDYLASLGTSVLISVNVPDGINTGTDIPRLIASHQQSVDKIERNCEFADVLGQMHVRVELASADTAGRTSGDYDLRIQVSNAGLLTTLVDGAMKLKKDIASS